jgi:hypothetical protein
LTSSVVNDLAKAMKALDGKSMVDFKQLAVEF